MHWPPFALGRNTNTVQKKANVLDQGVIDSLIRLGRIIISLCKIPGVVLSDQLDRQLCAPHQPHLSLNEQFEFQV